MKVIRRERVPSKDYPEKTLIEWDRWYALIDRNTGKYWSGGPIHSRKLSSELDEALIFSGNDLIGKYQYWHWFYPVNVTEDVMGPEEFANPQKWRGEWLRVSDSTWKKWLKKGKAKPISKKMGERLFEIDGKLCQVDYVYEYGKTFVVYKHEKVRRKRMQSNPTYNFQRRHYQFVADAITAAAYGHDDARATKALMDVILVFAKRFKADNPMFRSAKFIDAAGGDFLMEEELELLYEEVR